MSMCVHDQLSLVTSCQQKGDTRQTTWTAMQLSQHWCFLSITCHTMLGLNLCIKQGLVTVNIQSRITKELCLVLNKKTGRPFRIFPLNPLGGFCWGTTPLTLLLSLMQSVVLVNERSAKIITAIEHWFDAVLVCVLCTLNNTRLRFKTF